MKERVKAYKIVVSNTAVDLAQQVQALIDGGWQPSGGVSVAVGIAPNGQVGEVWAQAMVEVEIT